jgi:hypothetical protein
MLMRNQFPGYYQPTDDNFTELWNSGLFVVDANVLLNFYRYSADTSGEILEILKSISDRLWIPHQVALEYQENRLGVIYQQENAYDDIRGGLEKVENKLESDLRSFIRHPLVDANDLIQRIKDLFSEIKTELSKQKENHPDFIESDDIRDQITILFDGKVGPPYPPERMNEIFKEGEKRYDKGIPPGYLDNNKDEERKYGDLVIWFQVVDKAAESQKPIIFITDERKEDWWWRFKGKTLGPRPELVQEIMDKTGVLFYMYNTDSFMEYAREYLQKKVKEDAIQEVRRLKQIETEEMNRILEEQLETLRQATLLSPEMREALRQATTLPPGVQEALRRATSITPNDLEAVSKSASLPEGPGKDDDMSEVENNDRPEDSSPEPPQNNDG